MIFMVRKLLIAFFLMFSLVLTSAHSMGYNLYGSEYEVEVRYVNNNVYGEVGRDFWDYGPLDEPRDSNYYWLKDYYRDKEIGRNWNNYKYGDSRNRDYDRNDRSWDHNRDYRNWDYERNDRSWDHNRDERGTDTYLYYSYIMNRYQEKECYSYPPEGKIVYVKC
jgi:hypothetical protein